MSDIIWSDTLVTELRELWDGGATASECASALAIKFHVCLTRSAVIGKVHRLGLSGRRVATARHGHVREGKNGQRTIVRPNRKKTYGGEVQIVTDRPLPRELPSTAIPIEQRKTLLELTNETCRWPYGDPVSVDFFFCGAPEADFAARRPYCRFHTARACGWRSSPAIVPRRAAA
jgi:GcrA cell cycle regulator